MKITFNSKTQQFTLKLSSVLSEETQEDLRNLKSTTRPEPDKILVPKTESNIGILKSFYGFEWSPIAMEHLYSDLHLQQIIQLI